MNRISASRSPLNNRVLNCKDNLLAIHWIKSRHQRLKPLGIFQGAGVVQLGIIAGPCTPLIFLFIVGRLSFDQASFTV
jgi:hypothetical protein